MNSAISAQDRGDSIGAENYYRARYYDPATGRFLSEDPIGFAGGDDFYAYVGNRPAEFTDPQGLCPSDRLKRFWNCLAAYYGIDPASLSGLSAGGKWGPIASGVGFISKAWAKEKLGIRYWPGGPNQSGYTSLIRILSQKTGGQLNTLARFAKRYAGPIAIASATIDATALAMCNADYVPEFIYTAAQYDPFSERWKYTITLPLSFKLPWEN